MSANRVGRQPVPPTARIAVIGAGAAGLTAAHTLRKLGYAHVTVYEKEDMPGGRVLTDHSLGVPVELGAVFATDSHTATLQLAKELGVETYLWDLQTVILGEDDTLLSPVEFALRKYGPGPSLAALDRFKKLSDGYRISDRRGFAGLPPELNMPFAEYAARYDILPVADMMRTSAVAFGYAYYEDVPAMYYFKLIDPLIHIGPEGPVRAPWLRFSAGFQDLWVRLAKTLDVVYAADVTGVRRSTIGNARTIEITANGETRVYDWIIIATPPNATQRYLDMTAEESELFAMVVSRNYHVTVARVAGVSSDRRHLSPYANTRPEAAGHVNTWYDPVPGEQVFAAYQSLSWSQSPDDAQRLLTQDFATFGGGTLQGVLLHKAWDNFAHVGTAALADGFYDRFEALQGTNGTLYLGGILSFDTVEHTARYARDLVNEFFSQARTGAVS